MSEQPSLRFPESDPGQSQSAIRNSELGGIPHTDAPRLKFARAIVFFGSFCLMTIELVAGRVMAPYLGVSLYTWTSVIGVICWA